MNILFRPQLNTQINQNRQYNRTANRCSTVSFRALDKDTVASSGVKQNEINKFLRIT